MFLCCSELLEITFRTKIRSIDTNRWTMSARTLLILFQVVFCKTNTSKMKTLRSKWIFKFTCITHTQYCLGWTYKNAFYCTKTRLMSLLYWFHNKEMYQHFHEKTVHKSSTDMAKTKKDHITEGPKKTIKKWLWFIYIDSKQHRNKPTI